MRAAPLLAAILLLAACHRRLPDYQTVAVEPGYGDAGLEGVWYDPWSSRAMASFTPGLPGRFRLRAWRELRLVAARTEGDQIVLTCVGSPDEPPLLMTFKLVGEDLAILMRYGAEPSGCGRCTPRFVRNLPLRLRIGRRLEEVKGRTTAAYDAVMDRVIEVF